MWKKLGLAAVLAVSCLWGLASTAMAQSGVVFGAGPYELKAKDDGGYSVSVDVTNASGLEVVVEMERVGEDAGCVITAEPEKVAKDLSDSVVFAVPDACDFTEDKLAVTLRAEDTAGKELASQQIELGISEKKPSDFGSLWLYLTGGVIGVLLVVALVVKWQSKTDGRSWHDTLPGIEEDWSFSSSWSTNITAAAAVVTGVLGASSVLEKILGEDNKNGVAVAVVSAAITAGLVGAAPLVLTMLKRDYTPPAKPGAKKKEEKPKLPTKVFTVDGVILSSGIVVAASLGQLVVLAAELDQADTLNSLVVWIGTAVASCLLVRYAWVTIPYTMLKGREDPDAEPKPDSDAVAAAKIVAAALRKSRRNVRGLDGVETTSEDDGGLTDEELQANLTAEIEELGEIFAPEVSAGRRPRLSAMP